MSKRIEPPIAGSRQCWICRLVVAWTVMLAPILAEAQLVADGATCVLDNVATNLTGRIIVGTNGSFTLLMLTNSAAVTNTGDTIIGSASTAKSNSVVVTDAGSAWDCPGGFYIGDQGAANTLAILNGGLVTNQFAKIGNNSSASGNTVTVSGTNSFWNMYGSLRVGGSGSLNQLVISSGGKVADGFAYIGENSSSTNNAVIVTGPGSLWSHLNSLYIGWNGRGNELLVTNGGSVVGGSGAVGANGGGNNRATVTGHDSLWVNDSIMLGSTGGSNTLLVADGGTVRTSSSSTIGYYSSPNTALITGPGSLWTSASLTIGYSAGANQLIISNAAAVVNGTTSLAASGNALVITGAESLLTNSSDLHVGYTGSSNQMTVLDGGTVADATGRIGGSSFSTANLVRVSGAGSVWTNGLDLYAGAGSPRSQLLVSNAAKVFSRDGYIGYNATSVSNLVLVTDAGSLWSNQFNLYVGYDGGVNQLVVSNAALVAAQNLYLGYNTTATNNSVTLAGGTLRVTNSGSGAIEVRRGTLALNSGLIVVDRFRVGDMGPSGKFTLNGGTLRALIATVLNGLPFVVGDGTNAARYEMSLPGSAHFFANGLIVSSNSLLTGYGTIMGNLSVGKGGVVSPGSSNAISFITVTKGITLGAGSTTLMKLDAASGSADYFDGATNVAFGGTLQLTNLFGSLGHGNSFKLFNAAHFTGAFASLSPASPGGGLRWDTNQLNVDGTLRVFSVPTPAPTLISVSHSGGSVQISASGGIPYDPCYLRTSTNLVAPLLEWTPCATDRFDSAGNVSIVQAADPGAPQRFYRLSVE